jgi:hypothetical protein
VLTTTTTTYWEQRHLEAVSTHATHTAMLAADADVLRTLLRTAIPALNARIDQVGPNGADYDNLRAAYKLAKANL